MVVNTEKYGDIFSTNILEHNFVKDINEKFLPLPLLSTDDGKFPTTLWCATLDTAPENPGVLHVCDIDVNIAAGLDDGTISLRASQLGSEVSHAKLEVII